jgi:hypothetical protein
MKTKEEVNINGKPVFYTVLYNPMKKAALKLGYALALHGSMHSDMDLIAVAWTEDARPAKELAKAINECIGATVWKDHNLQNLTKKPHGRVVYSLSIGADWYIDLSIIPPKQRRKK